MNEFKSPVSRLARLWRRSRDNWKEKALDKQERLRALEIKVRDLSLSRENWKKRAMEAENQLRSKTTQSVDGQKKGM
ncbi:hypothetical protein RIVM261_054690 [Rivularia sp. IAM M-261]|nr:hypothetical protein RIVM261_054690 [Rivularia sp. IAM M-261]